MPDLAPCLTNDDLLRLAKLWREGTHNESAWQEAVCSGRGVCGNLEDKMVCQCREGYTGSFCEGTVRT